MAGKELRRFMVNAAAISVLSVTTGLFLGGALLPFQATQQRYVEQSGNSTKGLTIVHGDEIDGQHEHKITTVVTVTETSPHGYVHDFIAALVPDLFAGGSRLAQGQAPNEVTVWAREFHPNVLNVSAGTRVTWINKEEEEHTVTGDKGIFGGLLPGLGKYSYTFNEPGKYTYYCEPHPTMTGVVIVK